jgi:hypothetical protein
MAVEPQYEYYPIADPDGIRLIELQSSEDPSAPLKCSLMHTKLSLCDSRDIFGHYVTLSYVWGDPEKKRKLFVDGKRLDITTNLCSALLDLRDEQLNLLLWVDGICINQENDTEKATQVGLMGRIYAGALHTVVYLGPAAITDPECICLKAIQDGAGKDKIPDLEVILTKEWFNRVWVFKNWFPQNLHGCSVGGSGSNGTCSATLWVWILAKQVKAVPLASMAGCRGTQRIRILNMVSLQICRRLGSTTSTRTTRKIDAVFFRYLPSWDICLRKIP